MIKRVTKSFSWMFILVVGQFAMAQSLAHRYYVLSSNLQGSTLHIVSPMSGQSDPGRLYTDDFGGRTGGYDAGTDL